jgi:hypothetical protein
VRAKTSFKNTLWHHMLILYNDSPCPPNSFWIRIFSNYLLESEKNRASEYEKPLMRPI